MNDDADLSLDGYSFDDFAEPETTDVKEMKATAAAASSSTHSHGNSNSNSNSNAAEPSASKSSISSHMNDAHSLTGNNDAYVSEYPGWIWDSKAQAWVADTRFPVANSSSSAPEAPPPGANAAQALRSPTHSNTAHQRHPYEPAPKQHGKPQNKRMASAPVPPASAAPMRPTPRRKGQSKQNSSSTHASPILPLVSTSAKAFVIHRPISDLGDSEHKEQSAHSQTARPAEPNGQPAASASSSRTHRPLLSATVMSPRSGNPYTNTSHVVVDYKPRIDRTSVSLPRIASASNADHQPKAAHHPAYSQEEKSESVHQPKPPSGRPNLSTATTPLRPSNPASKQGVHSPPIVPRPPPAVVAPQSSQSQISPRRTRKPPNRPAKTYTWADLPGFSFVPELDRPAGPTAEDRENSERAKEAELERRRQVALKVEKNREILRERQAKEAEAKQKADAELLAKQAAERDRRAAFVKESQRKLMERRRTEKAALVALAKELETENRNARLQREKLLMEQEDIRRALAAKQEAKRLKQTENEDKSEGKAPKKQLRLMPGDSETKAKADSTPAVKIDVAAPANATPSVSVPAAAAAASSKPTPLSFRPLVVPDDSSDTDEPIVISPTHADDSSEDESPTALMPEASLRSGDATKNVMMESALELSRVDESPRREAERSEPDLSELSMSQSNPSVAAAPAWSVTPAEVHTTQLSHPSDVTVLLAPTTVPATSSSSSIAVSANDVSTDVSPPAPSMTTDSSSPAHQTLTATPPSSSKPELSGRPSVLNPRSSSLAIRGGGPEFHRKPGISPSSARTRDGAATSMASAAAAALAEYEANLAAKANQPKVTRTEDDEEDDGPPPTIFRSGTHVGSMRGFDSPNASSSDDEDDYANDEFDVSNSNVQAPTQPPAVALAATISAPIAPVVPESSNAPAAASSASTHAVKPESTDAVEMKPTTARLPSSRRQSGGQSQPAAAAVDPKLNRRSSGASRIQPALDRVASSQSRRSSGVTASTPSSNSRRSTGNSTAVAHPPSIDRVTSGTSRRQSGASKINSADTAAVSSVKVKRQSGPTNPPVPNPAATTASSTSSHAVAAPPVVAATPAVPSNSELGEFDIPDADLNLDF